MRMNDKDKLKEANSIIKQLRLDYKKVEDERNLLRNNESFFKKHAEKAGTDMFEYKKECIKLEKQLKDAFEKIESLKTKIKILEEKKVEENDDVNVKPRKNIKSVKRK